MATVTLNAYSKAYPSITNRIRASVAIQTDPQALVATIIDTTSGHPARVWNFLGLLRQNYSFSLDEIDGSGNVIQNLALFVVTPGQLDGFTVRADEQPICGVTPGFDVGASGFIFDGRETSPGSGIFHPDYRGWDIVPSELDGRGILKNGLDYSWNDVTAAFNLLQTGDIFPAGQYYNIHFEPQVNPAGGSVPTVNDFTIRLVTASITLDVADFGNKVIVEPAGTYLELGMPALASIPQGRRLMIEAGGIGISCIKILAAFNWQPYATVYLLPGESINIWKYTRSAGVYELRTSEAFGNFARVGEILSSDNIQADMQNVHLMDGSPEDIFTYARIYNNFVLNLPNTQVCNFDDWATGNNRYLFSLANSANPSFADKFHFPDRRGLFERNNNTGKAGDYGRDLVNISDIGIDIPQGDSFTGGGGSGRFGRGANSPNNVRIAATAGVGGSVGSETQPKNYLTNKYIVC